MQYIKGSRVVRKETMSPVYVIMGATTNPGMPYKCTEKLYTIRKEYASWHDNPEIIDGDKLELV